MSQTEYLYNTIETYAKERSLTNTLIALPLAKEWLGSILRRSFTSDKNRATSLMHCLEATIQLMDLRIAISKEEYDILLAAMLCHDMLENVAFEANGDELVDVHHLDPKVLHIVRLMTRPVITNDESYQKYYDGIKKDKLAVLVALSDRGNLVEQIAGLSIAEATAFVQEMRAYFLPMCVYAKEYYRDIQMTVNVMMEKIRCLIDVTDIISSRYMKRDGAYRNEILALMEENARMRGMIGQLKAGEEII